MSTLLPNTFQCFNLYIDRAMEHLTDSEVRVLWYATRHILGWQDKIKKQHGHISITMFEQGYSTESGKHYGGCGLGRGAIITACKGLVEFHFLNRIGETNEYGQEWELTTDNIQWDKLETRTTGKKTRQKQQTTKASIALKTKLGVSSNDTTPPVSLDDTMQGSSNDTTPHIVGRTESKPSSKPSSKEECAIAPPPPIQPAIPNPHPLIKVWAEVLGIDTINIGAPVYTTRDLALAKRMAKWEAPPTDDEIRTVIKASKAQKYHFDWLEGDIPKMRLAKSKPVESYSELALMKQVQGIIT